mmetsp:Transcript_50380/g.113257  ORF Transcript_50380/g.113257 Transcript_50380/m.113257 type:complete len:545 (-) Transcript_50380:50-1684(-)|eukprot:CAMPEP_0197912314 /NCGR_PEP_ID=MMETSP1439-20131203/74501_1 /TAXON_ID=66791 /ORGANISM="Gonyaulax spinifera, Strain CCMP409" /LENGTH=544 /DNA_ID=CAMNT_0043534091 /DNA_START=66 /DNA_END=1700 /DNA_ORIENTATION=+
MDVVSSTASDVLRTSTSALQVAAGALANQANNVAQLATVKDPLAWLAGDDEAAENDANLPEERPAPLAAVPLAALHPWGSLWGSALQFGESEDFASADPRPVPFVADAGVNAKVYLWEGDACALEVDALLTPTAAGYATGASTVFPKVLRYGGKDLQADLRHLDPCRSGEARVTKAYGLPCNRLLLTVGPKYKDKYHIAAQNTLNACYRECLQLLVESELRTVAIPCAWYHKGYPLDDQAHVALRTVRKCLEKLGPGVEAAVFVASCPQEVELYDRLLPLYFPRTRDEAETAAASLPECCWSEWGEVAVEERRIRLSSNLITREDDDDDRGDQAPLFSPTDDGDKAFLSAREDADVVAIRRLEGTMIEAETPEMAAQACLRYLRRARETPSEHEMTRFVLRAGQDRFARWVIVLFGARLPALGVRDERTLPLFVKELEPLHGERFVLLYCNSDVPTLDTCKLEVLQEMLAVISARYRGSLDQFLVLHPGLWFRAAFALGRAVSDTAASVWHDTVYLEGLADLAAFVSVEQLRLPQYVYACDPGG